MSYVDDLDDEIADLAAKVARLQIRCDNADPSKTYCAHCGKEYAVDDDAEKIREHIEECPDHPIKAMREENERLCGGITALTTANETLERKVSRYEAALSN